MRAIRLFDFGPSSASYRVRIALNLKGLEHDLVDVDLLKGGQRDPGFLAANPQGLVPALEIDGLVLTQSLAIIDYLEARYPTPRLIPDDPAHRAAVLAMVHLVACDIHPINNLRVLRYLKRTIGADQALRNAWSIHWIAEGLNALEEMVAKVTHPYLSGDAPGVADICLVPQLHNARRVGAPLDAYPTLLRIDATLTALPSFQAARPSSS